MKHKYILLAFSVLVLCLQACKKDSTTPSKITVVGKWLMARHDLKLVKSGVQIGETIRTSYTKDDFAQYFEDGTGYQSAQATTDGPSLNTFHYTVKGNVITLFINGSPGFDETITKLTETNFAVHYESQIPDPYNAGQYNNEIDDYEFVRGSL